MAHTINKSYIQNWWHRADITRRVIVINCVVYAVLLVSQFFYTRFAFTGWDIWDEFALFPDMYLFSRRPWGILTYMWVHKSIFHLLFNMLFLYWFGTLFLRYFSPRSFLALYLMCGIAGGAIYFGTYHALTWAGAHTAGINLLGSSAAVMGIIFGVAFYAKWERVELLFFGPVKIHYLAIALFILDIILLGGNNFGGHIAHLGGAALGLIFALKMSKEREDITVWLQRLIDRLVNWWNKINKTTNVSKGEGENLYSMHIDPNKDKSSKPSPSQKNQDRINKLLDKIKESGYGSLTDDEKRDLFDQSNKLK